MNSKELDLYDSRYINGEKQVFDIIYEETKKSVYLSIYTIIKNKTTIEDLMQDTYMKIINSFEYYRLGTNFIAWCSKIARNNAINYYKKIKREVIIDYSENENIFQDDSTKTYIIDDCLEILSGYEKEIFVYRIVIGLKLKEIPNILEMPISSIDYIYKKALKKVKRYIKGE